MPYVKGAGVAAVLVLLAAGLVCCSTNKATQTNKTPTDSPKPPPNTGGDDANKTPPADDPYSHAVEANPDSIQKNLVDPYCVGCHQGATPPAKLNLQNVALFADGHLHGYPNILISPGDPKASMIVTVIRTAKPDDHMPPESSHIPSVKDDQAKALEAWISSLPKPPPPSGGDVDLSFSEHRPELPEYMDGGSGFAPDN